MVTIERFPYPQRQAYHVRVRLVVENALMYDIESNRRKLTPLGQEITQRIRQLPGVSDLIIGPYHIDLGKGDACTWEDIDAGVLDVLERMLPQSKDS